MQAIQTSRLSLGPFPSRDFDHFVTEMLTDPRVVEFYYSYQEMDDLDLIYAKAKADFWDHFMESRTEYGLEIWAAHASDHANKFIGWCGLLHTELSEKHQGPELQYMIAGDAHRFSINLLIN